MKQPEALLNAVRNMRIKMTRLQESTSIYAELRLGGKNYTTEFLLYEFDEFSQEEIEFLVQSMALDRITYAFFFDKLYPSG